MPTLSNEEELEKQLKEIMYMAKLGWGTGSNWDYDNIIKLKALFATQNTALLKELLNEMPKKMVFDINRTSKPECEYYNMAIDKTIDVINSKLAAMGEQ